ncbi:MAG: hypothetical protein E7394_00190 [Ruminococcaceae bacterium]|nr:hypothetical protein [Oscillospiraceae bacterium]
MFTMTIDSVHDIRVFALSLFSGIVSGVVLDFFRASRRCFKLKKRGVAIQDIFTVGIIFIMFSYVVNNENDGSVRWYEFAGAVLGAMLYYCTVSAGILKCLIRIMKYVEKMYLVLKNKCLKIVGKFKTIFGRIKNKTKKALCCFLRKQSNK